MDRKEQFARILVVVGVIIGVLNTIVFLVAHNWVMLGLNLLGLLCLIVYFLAVWLSEL